MADLLFKILSELRRLYKKVDNSFTTTFKPFAVYLKLESTF